MNRLLLLRVIVWVAPLALTYAVLATRQRSRSLIAAALLGYVWNGWALLAINMVAVRFGWWAFHPETASFMGVPIEPWLGWTLLWGSVSLVAAKRPLAPTLLALAWFDLIAMPALEPFVVLGDHWLLGESLSLLAALLPGLLLVRWTLSRTNLNARLSLQVVCASALFLWLVPSAALESNGGWRAVVEQPSWRLGLVLQLVLVLATLGIRAAMEFADRGRGTPLPYDPPARVVTSGPYAYVRNPMQLSMVVIFLLAGIVLWNGWLIAAGLVAFAYGAGLAEWHEDVELWQRFGSAWTSYRTAVGRWIPRFRPIVDEPSTLLIAYSCGTCSSIGRWFLRRNPIGLLIAPAEDADDPELRRVTYVPAEGAPQRGVAAIARALEHINLGWAIVGWVLAMPVVSHFAQVVVDVFGPDPRAVTGLAYDSSACSIDQRYEEQGAT